MTFVLRARSFTFLSVLLVLLLTTSSGHASKKQQLSWDGHLHQLQRHAAKVGVQVIELPSGKMVWRKDATIPLIPASVEKIVTSYGALKILGPYYRFETKFYSSAPPRDGVISGSLYIKGYGDPYFLAEDAWQVASELKSMGINEIRGGIYVDNSFFGPEWEQLCIDGKFDRCYNPVVSATAMEFNSLKFRIGSGDKVGAPAKVHWFPPGDYVKLENRTKTTRRKSTAKLMLRDNRQLEDGRQVFTVSGPFRSWSIHGFERRVNAADPVYFFCRSFKEMLKSVGIKVGGGQGAREAPLKARELYVHTSPPLGDLLFGLNRHSNNFMAEMLLRTIGAEGEGVPGTARKGSVALAKELNKLGVPAGEVLIDSGSGLSRKTRVSVRALNAVLREVYSDFDISAEFIGSLARNGEEGTLRKRVRNPSNGIVIRGKTGTLSNVVGFSGYLSDSKNDLYAVTIILNGVKSTWKARRAVDRLLVDIPRLAHGK